MSNIIVAVFILASCINPVATKYYSNKAVDTIHYSYTIIHSTYASIHPEIPVVNQRVR